MIKYTTRAALRNLLTSETYLLTFLKAGYSKADRSRMKHRLEKGELSIDKMEQVLEKCGFTVAQEKQWNRPL